MSSENSEIAEAIDPRSPHRTNTLVNAVIQFFSGIALALLLLSVPVSYAWFFSPGFSIGMAQLVFAGLFTLACGVLAALFGQQVITTLLKVFESISF